VQREIERSRVDALQRYQFPEGACVSASGAQGVASAESSAAAARVAAGARTAAALNGARGQGVAETAAVFADRVQRYCSGDSDPSCDGRSGAHPNADVMAGSTLFERKTLDSADAQRNARAVVDRLSGGIAPPALRREFVVTPDGNGLYLARKEREALIALARSVLDARVEERQPRTELNRQFVSDIYGALNMKPPPGDPSLLENDFARMVGQFQTPDYADRAARADSSAQLKDIASMQAMMLELLFTTREEIRRGAALLAASVAQEVKPLMPSGDASQIGTAAPNAAANVAPRS
jgi:hypothetical protein